MSPRVSCPIYYVQIFVTGFEAEVCENAHGAGSNMRLRLYKASTIWCHGSYIHNILLLVILARKPCAEDEASKQRASITSVSIASINHQPRPALLPKLVTPNEWWISLGFSWDFLCYRQLLTHWGRDNMAAIFQPPFANAVSWMKIY